ncbi:MAG: GNAT family N-acetyltransferase [Bacilli bacterium]|nr:GNAT family N-acetyltransferase [Bacilli bacterium]
MLMKYKLVKAKDKDINKLIEYKKRTIYEYSHNLSNEEINKINNYIKNEVIKLLDYYCNIIIDNQIIGCVLLTNKDEGKLLDEIYIEEKYRNKGIGTDIIKNIINNNDIVYLWVYKENIKAISLYKKLGFNIIEETDTRYYMKYKK